MRAMPTVANVEIEWIDSETINEQTVEETRFAAATA